MTKSGVTSLLSKCMPKGFSNECEFLLLTIALLFAASSSAQTTAAAAQTSTTDPDGTMHVMNVTVPPSSLLSPEGQAILNKIKPTEGPGAVAQPQTSDMAELRRQMNAQLQPNVQHTKDLFPVDVEEKMIDGISVAIITPKGGVPEENKNRIILNAPGGGFRTGIRANGLLISIPISSVGKFKVISLLYRQAPEYKFPAATEDFTKVYRAVLKDYKPANVGFVGCSAGGALVAETVAALPAAGLPRPGVLGIYCAGAGGMFRGDSASFSQILTGVNIGGDKMNYFEGMDTSRSDITPANDPKVLGKFPPTLYLTGTRDFAMSAAAYSYRKMLDLDIPSELLIYDGLGHGFMTNPDYPESRDAYQLAAKFYDKYLGR